MLRSFLKSIIPATGLQQQCMKKSSLVLKEIQDTWGKKRLSNFRNFFPVA